MKLYIINENYINYLKEFDPKVPNVDYDDKYKLFLGKIKINNDSNINYFIPLTSYKPKFENMRERVDFIKICDPIDNQIVGAIDINNMIPVPDIAAQDFTYDLLRYNPAFNTENERKLYYNLSMNELDYLNKIEDRIVDNVKTIFSICRGNNPKFDSLRSRCCDYITLYEKALDFQSILNTEVNDIMEYVSNSLIKMEEDKGYEM